AMLRQMQTGIILATAIMYLRVLIVVALFAPTLALALAPALTALSAVGLLLAGLRYHLGGGPAATGTENEPPTNPLELSAALIFAGLFVVVSLASAWAQGRFGVAGLFGLAAVVGAADIDPFVLSIAQSSAEHVPTAVAAILIAASSNNLLKAVYTASF